MLTYSRYESKTMKQSLVFICFFFYALLASAQDLQEEFARFRSSQSQEFLQEVKKQDSIFALAIKENWKSFQLNRPYEYLPEYPKPVAQPENTEDLQQINYTAQPVPQKLRTFEPVEYEALDFYPEEDNLAEFNFYGQECTIKYASSITTDIRYTATKEYVSDFWRSTSQRPYQKLVNDLITLKKQLNIPGYGFNILIRDFSKYLNIGEKEAVMYQWFLLSKAGYNAKVGFSESKPVLIVASETKIYGKPYFEEDDMTFYVLDEDVSEIETYGKTETDAKAAIDFVFEEAPDLPLNPRSKRFQFVHGDIEHEWELFYNMNVVSLLDDFPHVELPSYFNSKGSFLLERSLQKQIGETIAEMTQVEAVSLLLSFTQKAFEYQTDQIQFGEERVFFPDQFIHYQMSDCDDRVVFLNYLIGLFTDVKTVALLFPQHIALGAKLPMPAYGESVDFGGNRFIFCDPTFYNAPPGAVIPQADRDQMKVLIF